MSEIDMSKIVNKIKGRLEKKNPKAARQIGTGDSLHILNDDDYIQMPEWWQKATNTKGLAFGRLTVLAGKSDSGKTSACIVAMKAAQEQGHGIIYVETESKTTESDLSSWGVNPNGIIVIQSTVVEEAFELMFEAWDEFKEIFPDKKLLIIVDSMGNNVTQRDSEIDIMKQNQKPGEKGKINRLIISKLVSKRDQDKPAILLVTYYYQNQGTHGVTIAGGDALKFYSALIYRTAYAGTLFKTVKGEKIKKGIKAQWTLVKNHLNKNNPGNYKIDFEITEDGFNFIGGDSGKKEKE